jgi:TPR repeat protein
MGWLGYYDSWLALGLLSVAFTRSRLVVIAVCLLTPWIDERFVLGLPLALFTRLLSPLPAAPPIQPLSIRPWFFHQALWPVVVVLAYVVLRLSLGGSGSSATLSSYLNQFVFSQKISAPDRLFGAWSGLRVAWIFVLFALAGRYPGRLLLSFTAALTAFLAVVTALDSSRSMVLLLPLLPLGWRTAIASPWLHPRYLPLASAALAVLACALPAHHVVGRFVIPVDRSWLPSLPLLNAQKNLGVLFSSGAGVTQDPLQGAAWYRRAAEQNFPEAQNNLAVLYASGRGVSQDYAAAAFWYHRAALQGNPTAQNNLGHLFAQGLGVTKDPAAALSWYRLSANQGDAAAQNNLGLMYASGQGVPLDLVSARHWTALAAHQNDANAQKNLAILFYSGLGGPTDFSAAAHYFQLAAVQGVPSAASSLSALFARGEGVPQDSALAYAWLAIAAARGETSAAAQLPSLKKSLSPSQLSTALLVIDSQLGKFSQNGK